MIFQFPVARRNLFDGGSGGSSRGLSHPSIQRSIEVLDEVNLQEVFLTTCNSFEDRRV